MPYGQPNLADWNALSGTSPAMSGAVAITVGAGTAPDTVAYSGLTFLAADEADDPGEGMFQVLQGSYERFRNLTGLQKSKWLMDKQVQPSPLSSGDERHTFYAVFERVPDIGGETNPA